MNKAEYLKELKENLKGFKSSEISEIVADINEHFEIGKEKGKSEEEIAQNLGDPKKIGKESKAYLSIQKAENKLTFSNIFKAILATIGLSFFNIVFILGPFLAIACTLIGIGITSVGMIIGGIIGTVLSLMAPYLPQIHMDINNIAAAFSCLGITFAGGFLSIISYYAIKFFFILTLKYLKLNINIITKGE